MKGHAGDKGITVRFVKDWPAGEIIQLYEAGPWWNNSTDKPSQIKQIIYGSYAFAVAVDEDTGKAVGMGRAISDGVSDAYIQDVVLLPEYRNRGLGKKLITTLRDHCLKNGVEWIALVAESGTADFYSGLGFKQMRGHTPMKYDGGKE